MTVFRSTNSSAKSCGGKGIGWHGHIRIRTGRKSDWHALVVECGFDHEGTFYFLPYRNLERMTAFAGSLSELSYSETLRILDRQFGNML
jgi:hypothetical protein